MFVEIDRCHMLKHAEVVSFNWNTQYIHIKKIFWRTILLSHCSNKWFVFFFFCIVPFQFQITYGHVYVHCPNDHIIHGKVMICIAFARFRLAKAPLSIAAIQLYRGDHVVIPVLIQQLAGEWFSVNVFMVHQTVFRWDYNKSKQIRWTRSVGSKRLGFITYFYKMYDVLIARKKGLFFYKIGL